MALASGETNYMAPASARQMASDLALLPMWYAEAGSAVLAPSAYNADFLKTKSELLGMDVALLTESEVADGKDRKFSPWGWDPALRKRLMTLGADQTELPSADYMNILREHSHRLQAVKLLPGLRLNEYFCGESFLFEYFGGVQCVRRRAGSVLVKSSAFRKRERIELV